MMQATTQWLSKQGAKKKSQRWAFSPGEFFSGNRCPHNECIAFLSLFALNNLFLSCKEALSARMAHLKIKRGLDIPITGKPEGKVQPLPTPQCVSLPFSHFDEAKYTLLIKIGESVKKGQPLVEDKSCRGRMFVAPGGGVIKEVRRGLK